MLVLRSLFKILISISLVYSRIDRIYCDDILSSSLLTNGYGYDPAQTYPYKTGWPTCINTTKILPEILTPSLFTTNILAKAYYKNDGQAAFFSYAEGEPVQDIITGGIFGKKVYKFYRGYYYWDYTCTCKCKDGRAATLINGEGFCLESISYYVNADYCNISEAKHHRDGVICLNYGYNTNSAIRNPLFDLITADVIKGIKKANTSVNTFFGASYIYIAYGGVGLFYLYPCAYRDDKTGELYDCATCLTHYGPNIGFLSCDQAQLFFELENNEGKPHNNTAPPRSFNNRPLTTTIQVLLVPDISEDLETLAKLLSKKKK